MSGQNIPYFTIFALFIISFAAEYWKYSQLYSDNFTVKISKYNFHCSRTIFGGGIKYISLMNWIFSGNILRYNTQDNSMVNI